MRRAFPILLSVLVLGRALAAAQDGDARGSAPRVVGLAEFVEAARKAYPGMRAAGHRVEAARARLDEAIYSPFFQFSANAALAMAPESSGSPIYSRDSQLPVSNPWQPVLGLGVDGIIPIWTFGKLSSARDAARAGVKAAENNVELTESRLIFDVRRAYYAHQMSLDVQQMLNEGEGKLLSAERRVAEKLDAGDPDANPSDRYRLATTVAEVKGRRAEAMRLQASTRDALRMLTAVDRFEVPECPLAPVPFSPGEPRTYVKHADKNRPEVSMLEAGVRARRAQADVITAQYLPDLALALQASYSYAPGITDQRNPFIIDRGNYQNLAAGLVARWNLDFVGNWLREDRALAELAETQAQVKEAKQAIHLEVETNYHEVAEARDRMRAWEEGHRQARAWFVSAAQGYQVGTTEPKELIDAVKGYFTARFSHLQAIHDFNVAVAKLERTSGEPLLRSKDWELSCAE